MYSSEFEQARSISSRDKDKQNLIFMRDKEINKNKNVRLMKGKVIFFIIVFNKIIFNVNYKF